MGMHGSLTPAEQLVPMLVRRRPVSAPVLIEVPELAGLPADRRGGPEERLAALAA